MENENIKKRVREDLDESELDSPEVKRLREDLLNNFEDDEFCTTSQDLDSFMKSFEEEISGPKVTSTETAPVTAIDLTSESGESKPDLGYLLEASDDELGLPPSTSEAGNEVGTELVRVSSESSELSELWGFDEQIPSYDSFEFGVDEVENFSIGGGGGGEYVALDGLFDYSDMGFGPAEFGWQPETLPAQ